MKKAFKGYIIEIDKDGNQVKVLYETIVFASTREKAADALIIEATKGGVVDDKTSFVKVVSELS